MRFISANLVILLVVLLLSGCASTHFQVAGQALKQPLCQQYDDHTSVLVLWGPKWRSDQKDAPLREAAAQRGIEQFFSSSGCFAKARIIRKVGDRESIDLSSAEIHQLAATYTSATSHILVITVRELGPIVRLLSSIALVEGGTEVVLDIRSVSPFTWQTTDSFTAHWQNGGPWVIKGVATLEQDIASALQEALNYSVAPK